MQQWWDPVDVTSWGPYANESRGARRPKLWLRNPDESIWLRKQPPPPDPDRPNTARRSEPAIELLALELARRAGIQVAMAKPATWANERGIVSLCFHERDEEHHPGAELLGLATESGSSPKTRQRRKDGRASATLELVREKLLELEESYSTELIKPFTRILVIDAWLGNGDRHSGNWALIRGPHGARLAPMYDPTACLGVELTDEKLAELGRSSDELIARYCDRCPSGFGGGTDGRTGVPMRELLERLAGWPEWPDALSALKPALARLTSEVENLLEDIPEAWLPTPRKQFAIRVLRRRVTLLG